MVKIEPRKPTDRGGWLCMPRLENCPDGRKSIVRFAETTAGRDLKTQELFITATWREHVVPCVR